MGSMTDGTYRISLDRRQFLAAWDPRVVLLPDAEDGQVWEVRNTGRDTFTLRPASSDRYAGYDGQADVFEPVGLSPERREWRITEGPRPDTFSIAALDGDEPLTLGLHPALIYPPMVALSPAYREDGGWTFESAG